MSKKKQPRPFFVAARAIWRVQVNGRQHNLGPDEAEAWKRYGEMAARPSEVASELVIGVIEGFLDWCERRVDREELAPRTFDWYKQHLQSFVDWLPLPKMLAVDQLKSFHVQDWLDSKPKWNQNHRRGAVVAIKRAFAWAEQQGHILKSPIRQVVRPAAVRREQFLTRSEFDALQAVVNDAACRDVLVYCWETGCRVQEQRVIEAIHWQPDRDRGILPAKLAKAKKRQRVILDRLRLASSFFSADLGSCWPNVPPEKSCKTANSHGQLGKSVAHFALFSGRPISSSGECHEQLSKATIYWLPGRSHCSRHVHGHESERQRG